jgi:hypothetical protein
LLFILLAVGTALYCIAVLLNLAMLLRVLLGGGSPILYFVLLLVSWISTAFWLPAWVYFAILTIGCAVGWWNAGRWALHATMVSWTLTLLAALLFSVEFFPSWLALESLVGTISFSLSVWGLVVCDRIGTAISHLTRNPSPETTARVVQLGPCAVGALRRVVWGIGREAQLAAVAALGQISAPQARTALQAALKHPDADVRAAVEAWMNTPATIVWHERVASN